MDQYFSYLIIFFFHTVILGQKLIYTKTYPSGKPKLISYHIKEGVDKVREEEFFSNGCIKTEGIYQFGYKQGIWKTYFPNGCMKKWEFFKDGILDGKTIEWYQNGNKKIEGVYSNGKKQGVFLSWKEDGSLILKQIFVNGLICNLIHYYNGAVINYKDHCE